LTSHNECKLLYISNSWRHLKVYKYKTKKSSNDNEENCTNNCQVSSGHNYWLNSCWIFSIRKLTVSICKGVGWQTRLQKPWLQKWQYLDQQFPTWGTCTQGVRVISRGSWDLSLMLFWAIFFIKTSQGVRQFLILCLWLGTTALNGTFVLIFSRNSAKMVIPIKLRQFKNLLY